MKKLRSLTYLLVLTCLVNTCNQPAEMKPETKELLQFNIIGISVRTTNHNGQSQKDIGELWGKFVNEKIIDKIPNKESTDMYCMYTDYENDANGAYTTILGCKVTSLDSIPAGFIGKTIPATKYNVYTSIGKLPDCVIDTWMQIWKSGINRKYGADFEIYGAKSKDPVNAEVETYVSIK